MIHSELSHVDLSSLGAKIDWDAAPPRRLQAGDSSALDRDLARAIQHAAALRGCGSRATVGAPSGRFGHWADCQIRIIEKPIGAARLAKAILCDITHEGFDHIAQMLGLTG